MLGTLEVEEAAKKAAGNWRRFDSFHWFRKLDRPDDWAIFYSHTRDSGLLEQSNAQQIAKALEPFTTGDDPDVVMESHGHWAVGHVDGFSLRVFDRDREITEAFKVLHGLGEAMADYPILNDSDYSNRGFAATLANVKDAASLLKQEFVLPTNWVTRVYTWLSDNDSAQIVNRDDRGGYPRVEALRAAFQALKFKKRA